MKRTGNSPTTRKFVQKLPGKPEILRNFVRLRQPMRGAIADYSGNANNVLQCTFSARGETNRRAGRSGMAQTERMGKWDEQTKSRPEAAFSEK